jgi:hypothetical protein
LQTFEDLSETQKTFLLNNDKIWNSEAVNYFKNNEFSKEMTNHFNGQNKQVHLLKEELKELGQKVTKLTIVMESLIKHEYYKKKYLESESNLSKWIITRTKSGRGNIHEQICKWIGPVL